MIPCQNRLGSLTVWIGSLNGGGELGDSSPKPVIHVAGEAVTNMGSPMASGNAHPTPSPVKTSSSTTLPSGSRPTTSSGSAELIMHISPTESTSTMTVNSDSMSAASAAAEKECEKHEAAKRRNEQWEKLREHEKEQRKVMEASMAMLTEKMIERFMPFIEVKDPGGKYDPETKIFKDKMKQKVEDLKVGEL